MGIRTKKIKLQGRRGKEMKQLSPSELTVEEHQADVKRLLDEQQRVDKI